MAVRTEANEKKDKALENINKAHESVIDFLHPNTQGIESYDEEFIEEMYEAVVILYNLKKTLNKQ